MTSQIESQHIANFRAVPRAKCAKSRPRPHLDLRIKNSKGPTTHKATDGAVSIRRACVGEAARHRPESVATNLIFRCSFFRSSHHATSATSCTTRLCLFVWPLWPGAGQCRRECARECMWGKCQSLNLSNLPYADRSMMYVVRRYDSLCFDLCVELCGGGDGALGGC